MFGPWQLAAVMAPSGALAWGIALSRLGLPAGLVGATAGAIMGVLGGWLLAGQLDRTERSGHRWYRWAIAYLTLLLLFLALVILPSVLIPAMRIGFPLGHAGAENHPDFVAQQFPPPLPPLDRSRVHGRQNGSIMSIG